MKTEDMKGKQDVQAADKNSSVKPAIENKTDKHLESENSAQKPAQGAEKNPGMPTKSAEPAAKVS